MEEELLRFIRKNNLSPFSVQRTLLKSKSDSENIFRTRDARSVHNHVLAKISSNFIFQDTSNLLNFFPFTEDDNEIKSRQEFFRRIKTLNPSDNLFLKLLKPLKPSWKPKYNTLVVTEDSGTFMKIKEINCPVKLLISESDLSMLDSYDLVQIIDCGEFSRVLESLPQAVFIKSLDEVYLERYLEELSAWKNNLNILIQNNPDANFSEIINELSSSLDLIVEGKSLILTRDSAEEKVDEINRNLSLKLKEMVISGESLVDILSRQILPPNIKSLVQDEIKNSNFPSELLNPGIPVTLDEIELEKIIKNQSSREFFNSAQKIKNNSQKLREIPIQLKNLSDRLILFDFISGVSKFMSDKNNFPEISAGLFIGKSKNIFLENPSEISFELQNSFRCSVLTGANSGGKTTLLEHIIQLISISQFGLPVSGSLKIPLFTDVYYFAKNKGSENKGAFENLLNQMSKIKPGEKTLILADEIESVTEPGVAGNIISATAEYFLHKNCFLVIATHLGYEIQKNLPLYTRIDGIEAKGLDERFNLIVDHNPVLGRLAHSTPELIVEKLANSEATEYFIFLNNKLKSNKK